MKRPIVKYYSMSSVLNLEPLMDTVSKDFLKQLDNRFATKGTKQRCDLGEWIGFYSWDVNGTATFSKRFGYMDQGHDFDHTIEIADKALD
ncbi:hypothetical protein ACO1O0_003675 [Amphichorda felina]